MLISLLVFYPLIFTGCGLAKYLDQCFHWPWLQVFWGWVFYVLSIFIMVDRWVWTRSFFVMRMWFYPAWTPIVKIMVHNPKDENVSARCLHVTQSTANRMLNELEMMFKDENVQFELVGYQAWTWDFSKDGTYTLDAALLFRVYMDCMCSHFSVYHIIFVDHDGFMPCLPLPCNLILIKRMEAIVKHQIIQGLQLCQYIPYTFAWEHADTPFRRAFLLSGFL